MARRFGLACLLIVGCSPGPVQLHLPMPRPTGAKSLILAAPERSAIALYGLDLETSPLALNLEHESSTLPIQAVGLDLTLDDLGLAPGPLERAERGGWQIEQQRVQEVLNAEVDVEMEEVRWADAGRRMDPSVEAFEIERDLPPCAEFGSAADATFHLDGKMRFMERIDASHFLMGTHFLELVIISKSGLTPIAAPTPTPISDATITNGVIRYVDTQGVFYRGTITPDGFGAVEMLPASPLGSRIETMSSSGNTILAVSGVGRAALFDGETWTELAQIDIPQGTRPVSAWAGGRGYYWIRGQDDLNVVQPDGTARSENVGLGMGVFSLTNIPDLGAVMGTGEGSFFRLTSEGWAGLGGDYGWWGVSTEPYLDGFFFLIASGAVGQYRPNRDLCPDTPVIGFINDGAVRTVPDGLFVAGWDGDLGTDIMFLGL